MSTDVFHRRIETDRLVFEPITDETVDPFELYDFVSRDDWWAAAADHMPCFVFDRLDQVAGFIDDATQQWADPRRPGTCSGRPRKSARSSG